MIYFKYILILVILSLILIPLLLFVIFVAEALFRGHSLSTSKKASKTLVDVIQKYSPGARIIYDLGCAHGSLSMMLKNEFPEKRVVGIDNSGIRIFFARLRFLIKKREVQFEHIDIFKKDLSDADVIYTYLWFDLMPPLEEKLQKELKNGALVITNTSHFRHWKPIETIKTWQGRAEEMPDHDTLFVYRKD